MSAANRFCAVKVIAESSHGAFAPQLIALVDMVEEKDWGQVQALAAAIEYRAELRDVETACALAFQELPNERLAKGRKCN